MKALLNGKPVDVWEISKTNEQPDWVKKAFAKNYLYWLDNRLRILMCGLNPSMKDNLKVGAVGTVGGGFCGYAMYPVGYIGDFIDATNHKLLSKKQFYKKYNPVVSTILSLHYNQIQKIKGHSNIETIETIESNLISLLSSHKKEQVQSTL